MNYSARHIKWACMYIYVNPLVPRRPKCAGKFWRFLVISVFIVSSRVPEAGLLCVLRKVSARWQGGLASLAQSGPGSYGESRQFRWWFFSQVRNCDMTAFLGSVLHEKISFSVYFVVVFSSFWSNNLLYTFSIEILPVNFTPMGTVKMCRRPICAGMGTVNFCRQKKTFELFVYKLRYPSLMGFFERLGSCI
jgi:hypothetical protein